MMIGEIERSEGFEPLRIQKAAKRIGISKVTGSLRGSLMAAYYMFLVPLKYLLRR